MDALLSRDIFNDYNISERAENAVEKAAGLVADLIVATTLVQETCRIIISGGQSIQQTLVCLARLSVPWRHVAVYIADERCVAPDDKLRNDRMIQNALVTPAGIRAERFFNIHSELGGTLAALEYRKALANISHFDIALLGVGPDGHIASLFPDHPAIASTELALSITDSPKPPPNRVSVGIGMLQRSTHRIVVVVGDEKSGLIAHINEGAPLPVTIFDPTNWFLDAAAVSKVLKHDLTVEKGPFN